jgi:hypothetical protein
LSGVLVRDGYASHTHLDGVLHALCGARLLRNLPGIFEADTACQLWARAMADTLREVNQLAAAHHSGREALSEDELADINQFYTGALARARTDNRGESTELAHRAGTLARRFDRSTER